MGYDTNVYRTSNAFDLLYQNIIVPNVETFKDTLMMIYLRSHCGTWRDYRLWVFHDVRGYFF